MYNVYRYIFYVQHQAKKKKKNFLKDVKSTVVLDRVFFNQKVFIFFLYNFSMKNIHASCGYSLEVHMISWK